MKRVLLLVVAFSQLGATDCGQVIHDPGFDLWCGAELCNWTVESGAIAAAPTWNDGDLGVSMTGDGVTLAQTAPLNSQDGTCVEFQMVTDIAPDAEVHLAMDVFADGSVDYDVRIPTASWAPVIYRVVFAAPFQGVRFRLTKTGPGPAVLAQISARVVDDCPGAPVALPPRPLGSWCATAADCASGRCNPAPGFFNPLPICGACAKDADCDPGEVCGSVEPEETFLVPYRACVPAGSRALGEHCMENAECGTGWCYFFTCSTCAGDQTCPGGQACTQLPSQLSGSGDEAVVWPGPAWECAPGGGAALPGAACLHGSDCASGDCRGDGDLKVCVSGGADHFAGDGRSCASDADCPANGKHEAGACLAVGTLGGICR